MKKQLFFILVISFLGLATSVAQAHVVPVAPGAPTQAGERARIRQGVGSGQLTPAEAARLRAREANITATKRAVRADGVITPAERRHVRGQERRASRAIYRQKHDPQAR